MKKCVFFDRDGIVNEAPGNERYITKWEKFKLIPGFTECALAAMKHNYESVIITNQRCVAVGLVSMEDLENMHDKLKKLLVDSYGINLLDILYCPHDAGKCNCRKPEPGMFHMAAEKHGIDLSKSWMIGDSETDIMAGSRAGCRTVLVGGPPVDCNPDFTVENMHKLAVLLEEKL